MTRIHFYYTNGYKFCPQFFYPFPTVMIERDNYWNNTDWSFAFSWLCFQFSVCFDNH
jgi:hypothetical protein